MLEVNNQSLANNTQYFCRPHLGQPPIGQTGNTGARSVTLLDDIVHSHTKKGGAESNDSDMVRRYSADCLDGKELSQRSGQVTEASHTSTCKLTESLNNWCERTVSLCPESIKQFTCSVKKGYEDYCPDMVKALTSRSAKKLAFGLVLQQLLVPVASATISTVTSSGGEFVAQYCHPSAQLFQQKLLERLNGTVNVLDTSGEDIIKGLNDLFKDEPDLAIGGLHYLAAEKTIKDNVVSYMEGTKIRTFLNYILDRSMDGVRNGTETFRDLNHLIYNEAGDVTVLSDYMKRALYANCVPIDYSTIACGQITVGQFFQHLGDVFGMDTNIYEGPGSTTDLLAQLRLVKGVNPSFSEATIEILHAEILHENVVSKETGERLYTPWDYILNRLNAGHGPKTISHIIHDELANQLKLDQDVVAILRPDCAPPPASMATDVGIDAGSSAIAAGLLGAGIGGVAVAAAIGGGIALYKHCKSSGSTKVCTDVQINRAEGGGRTEEESNAGVDKDSIVLQRMGSVKSTAKLVSNMK